MKKTIVHIDRKDVDKIQKSKVREEQKQDGLFDGRFKTKSVKSAKEYKRKPKHVGKGFDY